MAHLLSYVHAYDCLDQVYVSWSIKDYDVPVEDENHEIRRTLTFRSTGEPDREEWLRDVLVALLEEL